MVQMAFAVAAGHRTSVMITSVEIRAIYKLLVVCIGLYFHWPCIYSANNSVSCVVQSKVPASNIVSANKVM